MHIAVRKADQSAGNSSAGPEDHICVRSAGGGHGFVLEFNFLLPGHFLDSRDHFPMIAATMCNAWAMPKLDISVLMMVHRRIIGRMGDIDNQRHIGFE